jgi:hypothetical protein
VAVERAVKSAVERERVAWERNLEQGRARFHQIVAAVTSTGASLAKVKVLVEGAERELLASPAVAVPLPASVNHRPGRPTRLSDHIASAESSDGSLKLSSGERRILTALAQYPQGRSKVQVAVLTGYAAAAGGGFNNYLGALRSRGLIEGHGDSLTIADARDLNSGLVGAAPHGPCSDRLLAQ